MEISFATARLAKLCNSEKALKAQHGQRMGRLIQQRLIDMRDAEALEMMRLLPGRCHELTGNLKGHLAVDLVHPYRLVFMPDHDPIPIAKGGGLDWKQVTAIVVTAIVDYH